jgi:hypothetical protein
MSAQGAPRSFCRSIKGTKYFQGIRAGLANLVSDREHDRPTSWPNSIPPPRTGSIDWPNLGKGTPTKGVARRFHVVLWRNTDAQNFLFRLPVHDLHEKLHWVREADDKYAILLLFYCFSNIMSSACLRSHLVPALFFFKYLVYQMLT